jgi:hypothetical protein
MFDEFGNLISSAATRYATPMFQGNNWGGMGGMSDLGGPSLMTQGQMSPLNMDTSGAFGLPTMNVGAKPGMFDNFLGSPGQQGWGSLALGAASGLMNGFMGMQQLGVAKKTLNQNQRQFDLNYGAQQKMTNSRLADRQATRQASGLTSVGVEEYMKKYGI